MDEGYWVGRGKQALQRRVGYSPALFQDFFQHGKGSIQFARTAADVRGTLIPVAYELIADIGPALGLGRAIRIAFSLDGQRTSGVTTLASDFYFFGSRVTAGVAAILLAGRYRAFAWFVSAHVLLFFCHRKLL